MDLEICEKTAWEILAGTPDFVAAADLQSMRISYMNDAGRELVGIPPGAKVSQFSIPDFVPMELQPWVRNEVIPACIREGRWVGELTIRGLEGREIPVLSVLQAHRDEQGNVRCISNDSRSIEARARQQAKLAASVTELEDFYNKAPCGYHALDPQGVVVRINDLLLEWLGYTREEVAGKMKFTHLLPPGDIPTFRQGFARLQAGETINNLEGVFRRKDGSYFPVLLNVSAVRDERGEFVQTRTISVDISNLKRLEQEREGARNQLQHAARLSTLGAMAAGMAHEINQPIAHIKLSAQLIKRLLGGAGSLPEAVLNLLDDMDFSIERASRVIGRVQEFSRTRSKELMAVDLNQTLKSAMAFMGEALRKDGVMHALDLASELPSVQADPHQLEQVWINLISNARDALLEGAAGRNSGAVSTLVIRSRLVDSRIEIDFEDNGSGMSESTQQKLFQPFFTTKAPGSGTGLGLSISFSILQSLGGTISVRSELGRGTCFTVELPIPQTEVQV